MTQPECEDCRHYVAPPSDDYYGHCARTGGEAFRSRARDQYCGPPGFLFEPLSKPLSKPLLEVSSPKCVDCGYIGNPVIPLGASVCRRMAPGLGWEVTEEPVEEARKPGRACGPEGEMFRHYLHVPPLPKIQEAREALVDRSTSPVQYPADCGEDEDERNPIAIYPDLQDKVADVVFTVTTLVLYGMGVAFTVAATMYGFWVFFADGSV